MPNDKEIPMTPDIETLLRLAEAAGGKKWYVFEIKERTGRLWNFIIRNHNNDPVASTRDASWPKEIAKANADFIAAANPAAMIALCKRVKELEEYEWKYKELCK